MNIILVVWAVFYHKMAVLIIQFDRSAYILPKKRIK